MRLICSSRGCDDNPVHTGGAFTCDADAAGGCAGAARNHPNCFAGPARNTTMNAAPNPNTMRTWCSVVPAARPIDRLSCMNDWYAPLRSTQCRGNVERAHDKRHVGGAALHSAGINRELFDAKEMIGVLETIEERAKLMAGGAELKAGGQSGELCEILRRLLRDSRKLPSRLVTQRDHLTHQPCRIGFAWEPLAVLLDPIQEGRGISLRLLVRALLINLLADARHLGSLWPVHTLITKNGRERNPYF